MSSAFHLLVIDDDSLLGESLKLCLPNRWKLTFVESADQIPIQMFFHAAFVDMHLSKKGGKAEGPKVIEELNRQSPKTEIVAMSGDLSLELMESCLKAGAGKFLAKPLQADEIAATLEKIEALWGLLEIGTRARLSSIWVGSGPSSQNIKRQIAELKGEPGPILIEGETGTGKEVVFRLLHQQESSGPAITLNVASIPEALFESEIYGHVKGAFTGADSLKIGLAEAAQGGDLFIDEIEALGINEQVKLLRFIESGEIRRLGSKDSLHVRARIIVASNQNLLQLVKESRFREDLHYRLVGKRIYLPPLRERVEDIAELAEHFLSLGRPRHNKTFSEEALSTLKAYAWPGNVRELKRICEQLILSSPLPVIRKQDVQRYLTNSPTPMELNLDFSLGLQTLLAEFEKNLLRQCLAQEPDVDKAAILLQISRSSLYKKIKDFQL